MRTIFCALLLILVVSCNKEKQDFEQWNIIKVEGPATGTIHQALELKVYWPYSSGCDVVDRFEEFIEGNIINVKAYGHTANGICTADAGVKNKIYTFIPASSGIFEFRFSNKDNSIISHVVVIN
jgi:hypothetical protein